MARVLDAVGDFLGRDPGGADPVNKFVIVFDAPPFGNFYDATVNMFDNVTEFYDRGFVVRNYVGMFAICVPIIEYSGFMDIIDWCSDVAVVWFLTWHDENMEGDGQL